jgi:hypothetical protein
MALRGGHTTVVLVKRAFIRNADKPRVRELNRTKQRIRICQTATGFVKSGVKAAKLQPG